MGHAVVSLFKAEENFFFERWFKLKALMVAAFMM